MKTRILKILIPVLIIIFAAFYGTLNKLPSTAFAIGDLTVNWFVPSGNPIFVVNNTMPGDMETRIVNVLNSGISPRSIAVRGVLTTDPGGLASVMDIVISNGSDLYGGSSPTGPKTLADFFVDSDDPSGIDLFTLAPSANRNITFKVTFQPPAGNTYQNQTIIFDIKIGISFDLPAECEDISIDNIIFGTSGNDNLNGGAGSQLILGFEGNDKIDGGAGSDCIIGGAGVDRIDGGAGGDVIVSEEGNDKIDGGAGPDTILGGLGEDKIDGGSGNDNIFGGSENDNVRAGSGDDTVYGEGGNDNIEGDAGNDLLDGGEANDILKGGAGNDTLIGGEGHDTANGNTGVDTCDAETEIFCEL